MGEMRPGEGRIDLGLTLSGTSESGRVGAAAAYDHRLSRSWSLTAEAEAGLEWAAGKDLARYYQVLMGARGRW